MVAQPGVDLLDPGANKRGISKAAARRINLVNVEGVPVNVGAKRFAPAFGLAGGDGNRRAIAQPNVAVNIPWPQRFFEPGGIIFRELMGAAQCGSRIPDTAGVDQERVLRTDPFARPADEFEIKRFALAHRFPTELHRAITAVDPFAANLPG